MNVTANDALMLILLAGLVISAAACVIISNVLKASMMIAIISCILAIVMFLLGAPLAAVFELSVCAGLVTVIFISAISMTRVKTKDEEARQAKDRRRRFYPLPAVLAALLAVILIFFLPRLSALVPDAPYAGAASEPDVFWHERPADLVGQIIIVLSAVFGVLIFFKEHDK